MRREAPADSASRFHRGELAGWFLLALVTRALVAARTAMPGRDGASYLWMADKMAEGDFAAAFGTVFHPGYPLLVAPLVAAGIDTTRAAQALGAVLAAVAVVPLAALTLRWFGIAAARAAAALYVGGLWLCRYPAECLSEGPFYLAVATWAAATFASPPRPRLSALAAAAAYWLRPEGLALAVAAALAQRRQASFSAAHLRWFMLAAGALPVAYWSLGHGLTLTPKAAFNYQVGIGRGVEPLRHYFGHAAQMSLTAFEALGYGVWPLALWGGLLLVRRDAERLWLVAPFVAQMLVVPLLRSHARFLSGFGVLLLPCAALSLVTLARARPRWLALSVAAALLPDLVRLPVARGVDRSIERQLGEYLGSRLRPGERIVTEMPRLEYYAGLQPGPPRPITRDELLRSAADPRARFVVVVAQRSQLDAHDWTSRGWRAVSLPQVISMLAHARGLLVYERA